MQQHIPQENVAWQGNLPCVNGSKTGCANHNPQHIPTFFNPELPSTQKALFKDGLFKVIFGRKEKEPTFGNIQPVEEVWTDLPQRDPAICEPLPAVHSSVAYNLAFYHVNSAMKWAMSSNAFGAALSSLTCQGIVGSYPALQYSITPRIVNNSFLLQYYFTFKQRWNDAPSSGTAFSHQSSPLLSDGFRFPVCPHMTHKFNSCTFDYRNKTNSASMTYSLKNCLNQTFPGEWNSKIDQQPILMCCGMCFTEFQVKFSFQNSTDSRPEVVVQIWVYKDLGRGLDPYNPKWSAALRGTSIHKDKSDFGRIRNAFQVSGFNFAPGTSMGHVQTEIPPPYQA